ncbi:MAG: class I SAM-dependent methyltransferase [Terracidiphilus sp.]
MGGRGQESFTRLPRFAAGLYERLTKSEGIERQQWEIALEIASHVYRGRLLDVGCGPGGLLRELRRLCPDLELHGLDISAAMVERARSNLAGLNVAVRVGEVRSSGYETEFFDAVTSTGSFYLWDEPVACLDEIFRILRPGGHAWLYESCSDCDREAVRRAVQANLRGEGLLRRILAPRFFHKQLGMTYSFAEMEQIAAHSRFAPTVSLSRIALAGVPAFVRMALRREADAAAV